MIEGGEAGKSTPNHTLRPTGMRLEVSKNKKSKKNKKRERERNKNSKKEKEITKFYATWN